MSKKMSKKLKKLLAQYHEYDQHHSIKLDRSREKLRALRKEPLGSEVLVGLRRKLREVNSPKFSEERFTKRFASENLEKDILSHRKQLIEERKLGLKKAKKDVQSIINARAKYRAEKYAAKIRSFGNQKLKVNRFKPRTVSVGRDFTPRKEVGILEGNRGYFHSQSQKKFKETSIL